ncbi:hypothetical protein NFI96_007679 [Prochilodus magdalenae]|nr:hypothetical protein NFI96_007679 [Prochilodus magdalenae]
MMLLGSHFSRKTFSGTVSQPVHSSPVRLPTASPEKSDSSSSCLSSLPTWITQALCDLTQGEQELQRLREQQTSEVDEVNQSLDSAILGAQKEERRLLEKVEKDHREAQQRLQQLKRENAAAARVGQSLVDRQLRKMSQLKEQIHMWGRCPSGPNKSQLLRGVREIMQPWEISLSLRRATFQASPQPSIIPFGEINVQEHSLSFPVGVCGPQGQKCAIHTGEMAHESHVAVSEQISAACNGGGDKESSRTNSGSSRVVRKIRISTAEEDVLGDEVKLPSPKPRKLWPHKRDTSESSQEEDLDSLGSDSRGEDLFLAIHPSSSQGESEGESPGSGRNGIRRRSFSKGYRKQRTLVPVSSQEPSCPPEGSGFEDSGRSRGFQRGMSSPATTSVRHTPKTDSARSKSSYSCLDLSSKEQPQYGAALFTVPRRSPSPADSMDSSYTFTVRSASSRSSSLKGESRHSISTADLSTRGRPLINGKEEHQKKINQSNLSTPKSNTVGLKRSETLESKEQPLKNSSEGSNRVSRSLSMSAIEGRALRPTRSEQNGDRSRRERADGGLPKVEEERRTLKVGHLVKKFGKQGSGRTDFTLPSGVHAMPQGQLFVVDCGNVRVQVTDLQRNVVQQVAPPACDGTSRHCRNFFDVAANSKGLIALTCAAERALLVFNRHGRLLQTFGGSGSQQDFEAPRGVTVTRLDDFLVADIRRGTLTALKLDPKTGAKMERTVVTGFHRPYLVAACLTTGLMAVSERGNETGRAPCIRVLEPGWNTIRILGVCSGMGPVLTSPWGICIDADGDVLVADWGKQHRVVLYPAVGVGRSIITQGLSSPRDHPHIQEDSHHQAKFDRCKGIEFDAIAPDEKGNTYFFKGDHLWKGFFGPSELANGTFHELDEHHHLGHVDAAFRMHSKDGDALKDHDHIFFFLDDKVFSYYNHTLEKGFPMEIQQVFPEVPSHLDAAVECPKGECITDSVLFFKGNEVYNFDIETKTVKKKVWSHLPNCTSAFRWLEHYYCFHGHDFTKFNPVSGQVEGDYPKDARHYFMRCPDFGHGAGHKKPRCELDAISTDDTGKSYAFIENVYIRLDSHRDGIHFFPITRLWKEVSGRIDAAFAYEDRMYIIQGDKIYIYKSAAQYTLIDGYPKPLKEELGIEGPVNAAFLCENEHTVHIIKGQKMIDIDLAATPRAVKNEFPIPIAGIDAGLCDHDGVKVYVGAQYYLYESPRMLAVSRIRLEPKKISAEKFGCEE